MRFALLGDPVAHSVSPAIYRAAFTALGVSATYEACRIPREALGPVMRRLAAEGGGNITLPYKTAAAALLDAPADAVRETGACNCFFRAPGTDAPRLAGDNTDVGGFLAAAAELLGEPSLGGERILLLGAGGAARAVLYACQRAGAAAVDVWNRTPERADALVRGRTVAGGSGTVLTPIQRRETRARRYRLAVNATSLGLDPHDPLPCDFRDVHADAALDLVYRPGATAWVARARNEGIPAADGRAMLVHQAALSLRRWLDGRDPPLEAMRAAAERALLARGAEPACTPDGGPGRGGDVSDGD